MRLPKPIATGVKYQSRTLGSVYTAAQMKAYAAKAVEAEREACEKVCEIVWDSRAGLESGTAFECAQAIRARGSK
jgi:hypothetical protein